MAAVCVCVCVCARAAAGDSTFWLFAIASPTHPVGKWRRERDALSERVGELEKLTATQRLALDAAPDNVAQLKAKVRSVARFRVP